MKRSEPHCTVTMSFSSSTCFTYSTTAATQPGLAESERPYSVMTRYILLASKSAGTRVRSTAEYSANDGATESSAKFTGSPPPMSSDLMRICPYSVRMWHANSCKVRAPSACCSSEQPCEPTWQWSAVSHGYVPKAASSFVRFAAVKGIPNLESAPETESAFILPTPTSGLRRTPMAESENLPLAPLIRCCSSSMRTSSSKLSALICRPCLRANAMSRRPLAGESKTMWSGLQPTCSAIITSPIDAVSRPNPISTAPRRKNGSGFALTAMQCRKCGGKATRSARSVSLSASRS
mmetsp:Transcript_8893/g.21971  ORF Transcript_8893/g.21971 Transcript_8893/m.21971 type:complete len:293 (+) Transcript_8893:446-1324(+)